MTNNGQYTLVDGVKCYSPEVARSYADYPDGGFDLTDRNATTSFWVCSRNRLFKRLVYKQMLNIGKTKFLEVGCGTGDFIKQIVENKNLEITGSEVYLKGIVYAKRLLPSVEFIQFDVTEGDIGEKYDLIVAFDVLEHIENDVAAMANMSHMLNPGGSVVISVPQYRFMWSNLDEIVKHKRRYARKELLTKLKENGFEVTYATSFVFILFPLMLVSRILDKKTPQSKSDEAELEKRVKFPRALNWIFDCFMRIDETLIRIGLSLPFGGTLVVVANKKKGT